MATKSKTEEILKRMEEGSDAIFQRYEEVIRQNRAGYRARIQQLNEEYARAANETAAQTRIDLKNTLERMADSGLVRSGETVQATIAANLDRNRAMSELASRRMAEQENLAQESAQTEAKLRLEAGKESDALRAEALEIARKQENEDREYQWKVQNSEKSSSESDSGIVPERNAYQMLESLVERNSYYSKERGGRVVDTSAIAKALDQMIRDPKLSTRYRYELYFYGTSLGYYPN